MTQTEVEKETGISAAEISLLENGRAPNPPVAFLLALRKLYGVPSLEQLFGELPTSAWPISTGDTPGSSQ